MRVVSFPTGIAIEGEFPQPDVVEAIRSYLGEDKAALSIVDPPYGKVVPNGWDHEIQDPKEFSDWMVSWTKVLGSFLHDNAALYGRKRGRAGRQEALSAHSDGTPTMCKT